jgi:putative hemolysin
VKRKKNVWVWIFNILILGGILLTSCSTEGREQTVESTVISSAPTSSLGQPPAASCENINITNPAGAYCSLLGYTPGTAETSAGQASVCTLSDGTVCDAWEFLSGKCGQEYSYCARHGYGIQTVSEGGDPYSQEYAVCLDADGQQIGSVSELSGLRHLLESCAN